MSVWDRFLDGLEDASEFAAYMLGALGIPTLVIVLGLLLVRAIS